MKTVERPKVCICFPSKGFTEDEFTMSLLGLVLNSVGAFDIDIMRMARGSVFFARNRLTKAVLEQGFEYSLWIDTDMEFPRDALHRLMAHDVDIVGCSYVRNGPPFDSMGWTKGRKAMAAADGLVEMEALPGGFLLIKTDVFRAMPSPWWELTADPREEFGRNGEDFGMCFQATAAGFKIWCDVALSKELGHIGKTVYRHQLADRAEAA